MMDRCSKTRKSVVWRWEGFGEQHYSGIRLGEDGNGPRLENCFCC